MVQERVVPVNILRKNRKRAEESADICCGYIGFFWIRLYNASAAGGNFVCPGEFYIIEGLYLLF
jgi:hypothetical protein